MNIKIKYHNKGIEKMTQIPNGDWIDLRAAETVTLKAGEFKLISLGVSMKLPDDYEASHFKRAGKPFVCRPKSASRLRVDAKRNASKETLPQQYFFSFCFLKSARHPPAAGRGRAEYPPPAGKRGPDGPLRRPRPPPRQCSKRWA